MNAFRYDLSVIIKLCGPGGLDPYDVCPSDVPGGPGGSGQPQPSDTASPSASTSPDGQPSPSASTLPGTPNDGVPGSVAPTGPMLPVTGPATDLLPVVGLSLLLALMGTVAVLVARRLGSS